MNTPILGYHIYIMQIYGHLSIKLVYKKIITYPIPSRKFKKPQSFKSLAYLTFLSDFYLGMGIPFTL